jgi:hypothetical protein
MLDISITLAELRLFLFRGHQGEEGEEGQGQGNNHQKSFHERFCGTWRLEAFAEFKGCFQICISLYTAQKAKIHLRRLFSSTRQLWNEGHNLVRF